MVEEDSNHVPTPPLMNFDQELQIPDRNRAREEDGPNPATWRDIHEVLGMVRRETEIPEANHNQEGVWETVDLADEDRARLLRIWETAGGIRRNMEPGNVGRERGEPDEEESIRPLRRPRMSVRGYLSHFIRREDGNPSSSRPRDSPSP